MDGKYVVSNEDEAWALFQKILTGEVEPETHKELVLDGWPKFRVYVPGKRLRSSLTPYMMEGFVDFQRSVYRTHALFAHDTLSGRVLSDYEKQQLELVVRVVEGGSDSEADLWDVVVEIGAASVSKMEPWQIMLTILGLGLAWAGQSVWRSFLETRKEERIAKIQSQQVSQALSALQFTQEKDVERMALFVQAYEHVPKLDVQSRSVVA